MKKKIRKPLMLSRETLTSLNHGDLQEPVGMATSRPLTECTTGVSVSTCGVVNTQCVGY